MPDWTSIDPGSSAYFTPQSEGDGSQTLGLGDGSDWMDWSSYIPQDQSSSWLTPKMSEGGNRGNDTGFDQNKFRNWLSSNNYSLKEQNNQGLWNRGVFDSSGKTVGKTQQGTYGGDDLFFALGSMFLNPFGGIAAGGAAAGAAGGMGLTGTAASGLNGAVTGGMGAAAGGGNVLRGALSGGLAGGYSPDVAGMTGLGNGPIGQAVNGAVRGGAQSFLGGGDAGKGAMQGGIVSGLNSLGSVGGGNMDNPFGQNYSTAPWASASPSLETGTSGGMSYAPWAGGATFNAPQEQQSSWGSPALGEFAQGLLGKIGGSQGLGDLASGLMGAYSGYKRQRLAKDYMKQMSGNRDSYLANMRNQLMAKDAQRGRRSNIGGREVELQAKLAELDSRNAPAYAQLADARMGGLEQMFASGLRTAGNRGLFGDQYMRQQPMQAQMPSYNTTMNMPTINESQMSLDSPSLVDMFARRGRVYGGM